MPPDNRPHSNQRSQNRYINAKGPNGRTIADVSTTYWVPKTDFRFQDQTRALTALINHPAIDLEQANVNGDTLLVQASRHEAYCDIFCKIVNHPYTGRIYI